MQCHVWLNILSLLCLIVGIILTSVGGYYIGFYYVYDSDTYIICTVIGIIFLLACIILASVARSMRWKAYTGARPAMVRVEYLQTPGMVPGQAVGGYPGPPQTLQPDYRYANYNTQYGYSQPFPQEQMPPPYVATDSKPAV